MQADTKLDRDVFVRAIAHRGLHDASRKIVENTAPAFAAAIAKGYGIECDLRPAADGTPFVFHDAVLERLVDDVGLLGERTPSEIRRLRYRDGGTGILTFADFLDLANGRVPVLIEIKSEWQPPEPNFMDAVGQAASAYKGPLALMSFDPAVMSAMRRLAPDIPRGIVSGDYCGDGWWRDRIDPARAERLCHLLESGPAAPAFFAYHVGSLPTPVTRFVREAMGLPLFAWTVRSEADRKRAATWADAPIFEGFEP
ncbi:MAG: glycerophosphodiester phosphodiesterase family protein [Hyphomicrobiaceae bacterium]